MKKLRTVLTLGLLSAAAHVMGYSLTVSPTQIEAGQSTNLVINLNDAPDNLTAYQMMVYLPEGVTVQKKANGKYAYTANADRHDGAFTVTVRDAADGSVLIACFSADKDVLTGTSGELIRLPIEVASTVTTSQQGSIKNIEFTDINGNAYNPDDVNFTLTLPGGDTPDPGVVTSDVIVSVPDIEMKAGSTTNLIVNMQTDLTDITAYQMMVYLPEGVTVQKKANGKYAYTANVDRHDGAFTVTVRDAADGSVLIACFSADKDVLTGTSGELIRLPIEVASTVATSLQGSIKNIEFTDINGNAYNPADVDFALTLKEPVSQNITFEDAAVKAICVANWDTDGDGELSEAEAAAVTDLGEVFKSNKEITSFNELQYFTGLTSIGSYAFYGCSALTFVIIPEDVTTISDNAFKGCKRLTSVTIPGSVTSILESAFTDCSSLTSISIPESVTYISNSAFYGCSGLTSFTIPKSVTSIGNSAFRDCSGLTSVTIPNSVTSISNSAFYGCSSLTSITIPESVTSIGNWAFSHCTGLRSINVEAGNAYYDSRDNCNAIIETATNTLISGCINTTIPDGITIIGDGAFVDLINLITITIPNSVTTIDEEAFAGTGLTFISIPNSVEIIVSEAFEGCENLTNVVIGNGVTSIGSRAFKGCSGLTDVYCYAENVPTTNSSAFNNSPIASATLHVPAGSLEPYKTTEPWSTFGTIVAIDNVAKNITFEDAAVKALCVANWDTDGDGELSEAEATAVTDLGEVFSENTEITSFDELQYFTGLTEIGSSAFEYCSSLTSVTIPESVTSIGSSAFEYCSGLTSVTIPESVTNIGSYAFEYCSGLTSVTIPKGVTSIGSSAFEYCSGLTSVTIPEGVTSIGSYAFKGCSGLTSVTIPESVTSIGSSAFSGCSSLTSVTIPESVTSIEHSAFEDCNSLISVTMPESLITICKDAFAGCVSLSSVIIPKSVTTIGEEAFAGCVSLSSITIPKSVTTIEGWAFGACIGLTSIKVEAGNAYYDSRDNCNAIIETATNTLISGCINTTIPDGITIIGDGAFVDLINLITITIPNSVTTIDEEAFAGTGLTFISIPNSVEIIVSEAFEGCENLANVVIGNGVTSIGSRAFKGCSGLTDVYCYAENVPTTNSSAFNNSPIASATLHVPAGSLEPYKTTEPWSTFGTIVAIDDVAKNITFEDAAVKALCVANWDTDGDGELSEAEATAVTDLGEVFSENTEITSFDELQYFTGLTEIGSSAFEYCSSLTSVTIPESVTSIGNDAFEGCSGLTSVTIPEGVTSIGSSAFFGCSGLTSVTIPEGVTRIGDRAFGGCSSLTSVTIPEGVISIASSAFEDCSGLTSVTIPNSVTRIGEEAFYGCSGLTSVTIPEGVTSIGSSAFEDCSGLTSVTIPNSVTSIGNYAFYGCSGLTSVIIPQNVTSIGSSAFDSCDNLTTVMVRMYTPVAIDNRTFSNRKNATLYVRLGSLEAYQAADYWNEFDRILEEDLEIQIANIDKAWIMYNAIYKGFMGQSYYNYFHNMHSGLSFFLPKDNALCYYYDPASMKSRTPRAVEFYNVANLIKWRLRNYYCLYNSNGLDDSKLGTIGGPLPGNDLYSNEEVINRLKDIIDSHTIESDITLPSVSQQEYFLSKNGCPIKVIRDDKDSIVAVKGGFQLENERQGINPETAAPGVLSCPIDGSFKTDNVHAYVLNAPLVPTYRSVYSIFTNDADQHKEGFGGETPYDRFYELCTADGYDTEIIGCGLIDGSLKGDKRESALKKFQIFVADKGLDFNVQFFNNYHYTIFVPTNEAVQDAIDHGLPTWEDIYEDYHSHCKPELEEDWWNGEWIIKRDENGEIIYSDSLATREDSLRIAAKITYLTNFVRNHFAENSVFADKPALAHQEMVTASYDWVTGQYRKIHVDRIASDSGTNLRVCDDEVWQQNGGNMKSAFTTVGEKNVLARDISCSRLPVATNMKGITIDYSSTAVIHSIPGCLNHTKLIGGRHDTTWQTIMHDEDTIEEVEKTNDVIEVARYDLQGHRLTAPQRGINIIRMSDGTTRKVMVK